MNYLKNLVLVLLTLTISGVSNAVEVKMAKANWDTGYFQAEVYKQALEKMMTTNVMLSLEGIENKQDAEEFIDSIGGLNLKQV